MALRLRHACTPTESAASAGTELLLWQPHAGALFTEITILMQAWALIGNACIGRTPGHLNALAARQTQQGGEDDIGVLPHALYSCTGII